MSMEAEKSYDLPPAVGVPGSHWVVSAQTWRSKNQRSRWCRSPSASKAWRTRGASVWEQGQEGVPVQAGRAGSPFLCVFPFRPLMNWVMILSIDMEVFFIQSADSNADPVQKQPHRHTLKSCWTVTWALLAQSPCYMKLVICHFIRYLPSIFSIPVRVPQILSWNISCYFSSHTHKPSHSVFRKLLGCFIEKIFWAVCTLFWECDRKWSGGMLTIRNRGLLGEHWLLQKASPRLYNGTVQYIYSSLKWSSNCVCGLWKAFLHVPQGTRVESWFLCIQMEDKGEKTWNITWERAFMSQSWKEHLPFSLTVLGQSSVSWTCLTANETEDCSSCARKKGERCL